MTLGLRKWNGDRGDEEKTMIWRSTMGRIGRRQQAFNEATASTPRNQRDMYLMSKKKYFAAIAILRMTTMKIVVLLCFLLFFFPFSDSFSSVESFHKTAREDPWTVFPPLIDFYFYFDVCFFSFVLQHWLPLYSGCNGLDEIAVMLLFQWPRIKMLME